MRVGELCGLAWEDVDFENKTIHVTKTIYRIQRFDADMPTKTLVVAGSPKTRQSIRDIPLPDCMVDLLKELRKNSTGEFVFEYHGHPLEPRVLQYRFKVILNKAGLSDINFHALSHTCATLFSKYTVELAPNTINYLDVYTNCSLSKHNYIGLNAQFSLFLS